MSATRDVKVRSGNVALDGFLTVPEGARGLVVFAHGSGSSRHSPRNQAVAGALNHGGLATLLIDLLTREEGKIDDQTRELRFDIGLLAERVTGVVDWCGGQDETRGLNIGLFGSSTGAAAALIAAAKRPEVVKAVVSRGGRPDLAKDALPEVAAPTLLIVGGDDTQVIGLNQQAAARMSRAPDLSIVPGASHLFSEPGKLEEVQRQARDWFRDKLGG